MNMLKHLKAKNLDISMECCYGILEVKELIYWENIISSS